jgi:glycosyltransferase involved in cell wall biosynthesis
VLAEVRRLVVVSGAIHHRHDDRLYAYGPYAREIEIWADLFPQVLIAAPCRDAPPPGDSLPLARPNIAIAPQPESGGVTFAAKAKQAFLLPLIASSLVRAMRQGDAIHVRCPCNLGLVAAVLAPLLPSRRRVAKFAGQWDGYPGEPWSVRLQRSILGSAWWRGITTVYGKSPEQPPHVVPFFTSLFGAEHLARARAALRARKARRQSRVLYVGRLSAAKNVDTLLEAVARLESQRLAECVIVGDGPQRAVLERQARALRIADRVTFVGAVQFERVLDFYEQCDILVLASESEGWGKAITEAMAFGMVCIGSDRGPIPEILGEGRGIVVQPRDADALANAIREVMNAPERWSPMRRAAAEWAQQYSLPGLRKALEQLLTERWHLGGPSALSAIADERSE